MGGAVGGGADLRLRPHPAARERLLDRHPAARRCRGSPARRPRLLLHPHRPHRALPADARQVGLLPDGLGRQRPAHRAPGAELLRRPLRPVAALRRPTSRPPDEAGPEAPGPDQPAQLRRAVRAARRGGRAGLRGRCGARSASRSTGPRPTPTIGPKAQAVSQRAFLRNFARGEAYLPGGADAVGRHLPDRGRPGRARGARVPRRLPPGGLPPPRRRPRSHDRDHPPGADRQRGGADRPPRRRALPAAVRHHGHLAGLRRRDPGRSPTAPPRWTRAPASPCAARSATSPTCTWWRELQPAGPHGDRPRRPLTRETPAWLIDSRRGARPTSAWPARPCSPPARRWSRCCASPATSTASRSRHQRMANFYEKGDKPLEIVATRQWYIRNGGRDAELRAEMLDRGARDHLGPGAHEAPLRQLGRRPQRRLADLPAALLRHPVPGLVPARRRGRARLRPPADADARPSCRSTRPPTPRAATPRTSAASRAASSATPT